MSNFSKEQGVIYNITVHVEHDICEPWLEWMIDVHIPEMMTTGCFVDCRVVRLLETDEHEGVTYAVQLRAASRADYNRYITMYAEGLRQKSYDQWGDRFVAFRSVMEIVH